MKLHHLLEVFDNDYSVSNFHIYNSMQDIVNNTVFPLSMQLVLSHIKY